MRVGIIGKHGSGKTTIFKALTGISEEHRESTGVGVVEVPDERLDLLYSIYPEKNKIPSRLGIVDAGVFDPSSESVLNVDAYLLVVGAFYGEEPTHVWNEIRTDMIVSDQDKIEKRLKKIEKEHGANNEREEKLLKDAFNILDNEEVLYKSSLEEEEVIRGYNFFTFKPLFTVINISENQSEEDFMLSIKELEIPALVFKGELEAELQDLNPDERREYMELYDIEESAIDRLTRTLYSSIGLITFFTVGKDEVRGWRLKEGSSVLEAAGRIHTDMEKGFIKAEVIPIDELISVGGEKEARDKGLIRLAGKDYTVQDGDVLRIRFS